MIYKDDRIRILHFCDCFKIFELIKAGAERDALTTQLNETLFSLSRFFLDENETVNFCLL